MTANPPKMFTLARATATSPSHFELALPAVAAAIKAPTLLVRGEWDVDAPSYMAQALFPLFANAPAKQYLEIGEGTHSIMLERNRMQLFRAVQGFLDAPGH